MASPGLSGMIVPMASIALMRAIDTEDPDTQTNITIVFAVVHSIIIALLLFLRVKLAGATDDTMINVPTPDAPFMPEEDKGKSRNMTAAAYDLEQWQELAVKKVGMALVIISVMYFKFGHIMPLMFQCFHNPKQIYDSPLVKVHLLGLKAEGDLARPWTAPNPLAMFGMGGNTAAPPAGAAGAAVLGAKSAKTKKN
jgi:hypothetical protein